MRSERRHHRERLKKARATYWAGYASERAGHAVDTPTRCSCWMCGNPRRHLGEKSLQERSAEEITRRIER
ncbi:MAG: hypothetical protein QM777_20595 [Pseudorhodoferax sp.]